MGGSWLTIYSSLPQQGPSRAVAEDVLAAQRLALEQAGERVGPYRVRLVALDAASPKDGRSDPSLISENARRAARNPTTIAYLGELASGTSAISLPLLNEAGILQVSPLDSAMMLTTGSIAVTGSPERFYPKLDELGRTFARVVPSDRSQAETLVAAMGAARVGRLAVMTDEDPSGRALATRVRTLARPAGIAVVADEEIDVHAREHEETVTRIAEARPDAVLDATGARPGAARLWRELMLVERGSPRVPPASRPGSASQLLLFAPASRAEAPFLAALGPAEEAARVMQPLPAQPAASPPARRFQRAFAAHEGRDPLPDAAFGYEAMRSVLTAIRQAVEAAPDGRVTRAAVVREYFGTRQRGGVLGPYAIVPAGDSSLRRWGVFRVIDGELRGIAAPADASAEG